VILVVLWYCAWGFIPMRAGSAPAIDAFVPIGVHYRPAADAAAVRRDLEAMRRLHFNVVAIRRRDGQPALNYIDRMLAHAPFPGAEPFAGETPSTIAIADGPGTTLQAWRALARGSRVILFGDWAALQRNTGARQAASAFAEAVGRNAALYAPMRPRQSPGDVRVSPETGDIEAATLESPDALLVIAINRAAAARRVVLTFSNDLPEAIWQNMSTGATVSFIMTSEGPTYSRTFRGREVLILMINKRVRAGHAAGGSERLAIPHP
jgi:hypothetical protein